MKTNSDDYKIVGKLILKNDETLKIEVFEYSGIKYIKLLNGRSLLLDYLNMEKFIYCEVE